MSANFNPVASTDEISVGTSNLDLTTYLETLESNVDGKAPNVHEHTDLVAAIDGLEDAVAALQNSGGNTSGTVAPLLIASMHLGKLDNNSGAETASSTRICSDPFAVTPGNSYWQVNTKGVKMYALLYDADELFVGYLGNFDSGAEIAVTNQNAAYMRLGSNLGEYDLANEFRIYDVDPASGGAVEDEEGFTKEAADQLYAPIDHDHEGYASADHTHGGYIEDTTNPGCYYRMISGEKEWLNPPMKLGVAYRTAERYKGKPVYTKLIELNKPAANSDDNALECADTDTGVSYTGTQMFDISVMRLEITERTTKLPFFNIHGELVDWAFLYDAKPFLGASTNHVVRLYSKSNDRTNVYDEMFIECTLKWVKA